MYNVMCFNPSQVQFTLIYDEIDELLKLMFQSLTGSIHTKDGTGRLQILGICFNPSQVQFTPPAIAPAVC